MENKYFTPDIEDVHVGYQCETLKVNRNDTPFKKWREIVLQWCDIKDIMATNELDNLEFFRVPYLTKEQIEAEGWKHHKDYPEDKLWTFTSDVKNYMLGYDYEQLKVKIEVLDPSKVLNYFDANRVCCQCEDINTFRKIIKLLGI